MTHTSSPVERVHHGGGSAERLPEELERLGVRRVVLVSSRTLSSASSLGFLLEERIGSRHQATYSGLSQHTPSAAVSALAALLRDRRADGVVSLGGGSVIDGSKAAIHEVGAARVQHLAVPTTLSGAEFTQSAGITDGETHQKVGISDRAAAPRVVFLDPELARETPSQLWLGSGLRAIDHAVETVLSERRDPLAELLALAALPRLLEWLPRCREDPTALTALYGAQLGAWWAALGLASVPMGPSHLLGKLLGARFDIPHGITSCVLLPTVLEVLAARDPERVSLLAPAFGAADAGQVASRCRAAIEALGLPGSLSSAGLARSQLPLYLATVPAEWREAVRAAY